jgi:hypothetical protein
LTSFDFAPAARPWRFVPFRTCTVTVFGAGTTVTGAGEQDVEDLADEASELTRWITRHHTMAVSSASMRRNTKAGNGRRAVLGRTGSTMSTPRFIRQTHRPLSGGRGMARCRRA